MSDSDRNELAQCPECRSERFKNCVHALRETYDSGKGRGDGRRASEMDLVERMNMPLGYRLAHGFSILKGGDI